MNEDETEAKEKMEGKVKVSSVQMHVVDNDLEANMKKAEEMAMRIHDREKDVDLILYHECCLEGGIPLDSIDEDMTRRVMEFWSNLAKKCGSHILAGRLERKPEGIYNKATVFNPQGEVIADYAKIHLFNSERDTILPGDQLSVFTINGMRIGIMICADFGFPELARKYATSGKVDVLAVSSSWAYPDDDLWDICNRARSSENACYVVSVDRVGPTCRGNVKVGRSMVCDPNGFIIANLVEKEDIYFVTDLFKSEVDDRRKEMKWLEWIRPEVYAAM